MNITNNILSATLGFFLSAMPALATCAANSERSLSYCSGVLGRLSEIQSQEHTYFDDNFLKLVAFKGDKKCGYYKPISNVSEVQWRDLQLNAGKLEFNLRLMDGDKLTPLLRECVDLFKLHYSEN